VPGDASRPDQDQIVRVLRRRGARFAFLHGSRAAGSARPDSDVDVAAWFGRSDHPTSWELAAEIGGQVDVLVLDGAPLELAGRVALHGTLLFDDDPSARVAWQADTRVVYLDEEPLQRELDRVFKEGRTRGR
jgi:predicted nucleotidyltransferase